MEIKNNLVAKSAALSVPSMISSYHLVMASGILQQDTHARVILLMGRAFRKLPKVNLSRLRVRNSSAKPVIREISGEMRIPKAPWDRIAFEEAIRGKGALVKSISFDLSARIRDFDLKISVFELFDSENKKTGIINISAPVGKTKGFRSYALDWLNGNHCIQYSSGIHNDVYTIVHREWDEFFIREVGFRSDLTGRVDGNWLSLRCLAANPWAKILDALYAYCWAAPVKLEQINFRVAPENYCSLVESFRNVAYIDSGIVFGGNDFLIDPPNLEDELVTCDLVPIGFIGGQNPVSGIKLRRILKDKYLWLDLDRSEGGMWQYALSSVDFEVPKSRRARLIGEVNALLEAHKVGVSFGIEATQ